MKECQECGADTWTLTAEGTCNACYSKAKAQAQATREQGESSDDQRTRIKAVRLRDLSDDEVATRARADADQDLGRYGMTGAQMEARRRTYPRSSVPGAGSGRLGYGEDEE